MHLMWITFVMWSGLMFIQGLALLEANYEATIAILQIILAFMDELLRISNCSGDHISQLCLFTT